MEFGISMFPTDYALSVVELARAVEERGLDALYFPEHIHIPTSRLSPFPSGGELPKQYYHAIDPFAAIGAAAAVTERIKLGTAICLVIERDTITLAREVSSVDLLSNGRFVFGIGGGWNREEMENHGTNPKTRWRKLREQIRAMKEIWTKDAAEFHGDFVNFDPIWQWPKPVQQPHPPIVYGGDGPGAFERIVDYCDGWLPISGRNPRPIEERIEELNRLAAEKGRGPIPVTISATPRDPKAIERFRQVGAVGCNFGITPAGREEILPQLDQIADLIRPFR